MTAWNWDRRIFTGSAERFLGFWRKHAEQRQIVPLAQHSEHAIRDLVVGKLEDAAEAA